LLFFFNKPVDTKNMMRKKNEKLLFTVEETSGEYDTKAAKQQHTNDVLISSTAAPDAIIHAFFFPSELEEKRCTSVAVGTQ
ncbi:hypothetical protein ACJX0J_011425, partial [Zea mays]